MSKLYTLHFHVHTRPHTHTYTIDSKQEPKLGFYVEISVFKTRALYSSKICRSSKSSNSFRRISQLDPVLIHQDMSGTFDGVASIPWGTARCGSTKQDVRRLPWVDTLDMGSLAAWSRSHGLYCGSGFTLIHSSPCPSQPLGNHPELLIRPATMERKFEHR